MQRRGKENPSDPDILSESPARPLGAGRALTNSQPDGAVDPRRAATFGPRLIAAQEQERQRIARELHDDISQRLALLAIDVTQLRDQTPDNKAAVRGRASALLKNINALHADVHRLSHNLHSSILDNVGLVAALRSHCREISERHGIAIEFAFNERPESLPYPAALCLYRVAQESLQNVTRHSGASQVQVVLDVGAEEISLTVSDDGQGFDPRDENFQLGLGLQSMEERARQRGGSFSIEGLRPRGTRVRATLPLGFESAVAN